MIALNFHADDFFLESFIHLYSIYYICYTHTCVCTHAPKLLEPFLLHHSTLYYFAPQLRFILRIPIPSDFCLNPKIMTPLS